MTGQAVPDGGHPPRPAGVTECPVGIVSVASVRQCGRCPRVALNAGQVRFLLMVHSLTPPQYNRLSPGFFMRMIVRAWGPAPGQALAYDGALWCRGEPLARGRCEATTGRYSRPTRECRVSTAPLQDRLLWRSPPRTIKGRPGTLDPRKELDAAVTILRPQSVCLAAGRWRSCRWLGRFARRLWRRSGGEGGHFRVVDGRLLRSCNPSCDSFGQLAQP